MINKLMRKNIEMMRLNFNKNEKSFEKNFIIVSLFLFIFFSIFSASFVSASLNSSYVWLPNSTINSSLSTLVYSSIPSVFYKDSSWNLISGDYYGAWWGYTWNGTTWKTNSTVTSSLPDIGYRSAPSVFYKDGAWYMISGDTDGTFHGFQYDGADWFVNSTINASLPDIGDQSAPSVFYKDGALQMIAGNSVSGIGGFPAFTFNGTGWTANATINSSLIALGTLTAPCVFNDSNSLYMLVGTGTGNFRGYYFNGANWGINSTVNKSLPDIGSGSTPSVFYKDGSWNILSGDVSGGFVGFTFGFPIDVTVPYFTYIPPNVSINYTQGFGVDFNASDETGLKNYSVNDTIHFKINSSGWLTNSTPNLAVGNYYLNITINDTSDNINSTIFFVNVSKTDNPVTLLLLGLASNSSITFPQQFNATASGVGIKIYRDGVDVTSENGLNISLGGGYYIYSVNATGNENYTTNSTGLTYSVNVSRAVGNGLLFLNGVENNLTIGYGNETNATAISSTGQTIVLYRDGINRTSENGLNVSLSGGYYNYTAVVLTNNNYTEFSITRWLNITGGSAGFWVNISYPENNTDYTNNVSELNYTFLGASYCWYSINNGLTNSTPVVAGTNFTGITSLEGNNSWVVYCNNTLGVINNSKTISFFKDSIKPIVISYNPVDGYSSRSSSFDFKYNVSETNGINNCSLIVNGIRLSSKVAISKNTEEIFSLSFSNNGTFIYSVECVDEYNNIGSSGNRTLYIEPSSSSSPFSSGSSSLDKTFTIFTTKNITNSTINKNNETKNNTLEDLTVKKSVDDFFSSLSYVLFEKLWAVYILCFFALGIFLWFLFMKPKKKKRIKRGKWT